MRQIAIFSDLHLEFSFWEPPKDWNKEDFIWINAGDTSPAPVVQNWLDEQFPFDKYFRIWGNHDYWNNRLDNYTGTSLRQFGDITVAGCTLWTKLDPMGYLIWQTYLRDHPRMPEMTERRYNQIHEAHKEFLLNSEADIIVSHHGPTWKSVHRNYNNDIANCCFVTDLSNEILDMKKPPKYWIHGHTHNQMDYMIGNTRVICHPRGYPHEPHFKDYKPMVVLI